MTTETRTYTTTDIALASYLHASGDRLLVVNDYPGTDRFADITFEVDDGEMDDILKQWQTGQIMVNAKAFYDSYKTLQRKVHGR